MGSETNAELFASYGLSDVPRISDPEAKLYRAFKLQRGKLSQFVGPAVWWRGFQSFILNRHPVGMPVGDPAQMPGAFLIYQGRILRSYVHQTSGDRPDYVALAQVKL